MLKTYGANFLNDRFMHQTETTEQDDTSVTAAPRTLNAMHYQQHLIHCGGPSIVTVQQSQHYNITKPNILLDMITLNLTNRGHPQL